MDDKIKSIIEALLYKTQDGKALWQESGKYGEYLLPMEDSSITISNDYADNSEYSLKIFNSIGNLVVNYRVRDIDPNSNYILLSQLYMSVVQYYNRVDTTLAAIINQLNSLSIVGNKK